MKSTASAEQYVGYIPKDISYTFILHTFNYFLCCNMADFNSSYKVYIAYQ